LANDPQFPEKTAAALVPLIKLLVLANAGGAIATMSVIGATANNGSIINLFAVPLAFFLLGVVCVISYSTSYFLRIAAYENWMDYPKILGKGWFMEMAGYGAIVCFISGSLSGVILIAIA